MITINQKTYKQKYFGWIYSIENQITKWISEWFLEEVKENKEILDIDKKLSEQFIKDNVACTPCEMWKPNSILEKLREAILNVRKDYYDWKELHFARVTGDLLDLLTSLEQSQTKEQREIVEKVHKEETALWMYETFVKPVLPQFTPWQEEPEDLFTTCKCDACKDGDAWLEPNMKEWTPIEGEEIEVSNDGKEWLRDIFEKMEEDWLLYYTKNFFWYFDYARPIKDSKELLPEFNSLKTTDIGRDLQIERITHFLHSQFPNSKPWKN